MYTKTTRRALSTDLSQSTCRCSSSRLGDCRCASVGVGRLNWYGPRSRASALYSLAEARSALRRRGPLTGRTVATTPTQISMSNSRSTAAVVLTWSLTPAATFASRPGTAQDATLALKATLFEAHVRPAAATPSLTSTSARSPSFSAQVALPPPCLRRQQRAPAPSRPVAKSVWFRRAAVGTLLSTLACCPEQPTDRYVCVHINVRSSPCRPTAQDVLLLFILLLWICHRCYVRIEAPFPTAIL